MSLVETGSSKRLLLVAAASFIDIFKGGYTAAPRLQCKSCLQMQVNPCVDLYLQVGDEQKPSTAVQAKEPDFWSFE